MGYLKFLPSKTQTGGWDMGESEHMLGTWVFNGQFVKNLD